MVLYSLSEPDPDKKIYKSFSLEGRKCVLKEDKFVGFT